MSRPIDEKIVKMTLDNSKFKEEVSNTLNAFSMINNTIAESNSIDLGFISKGISAIEGKLSGAGVMMGTVINRLTNSAMDMGTKLYSAMIDPIVEGGKKRALNIEQAKFQFEGLGMDVEATMKNALDAVKGTAFGLDEAAVVASQFGATGMKSGKEMTTALRGISGVAAMAGTSFSDIGNIFTTVAGNGRLMGMDLTRLGARGINAAATLAKSMGTTEAAVRNMVSNGAISFEMFAGAMSDAFGEHATKANDTYTGSLSNLRAAFARIGAEIYAPGFERKRDIFNALTPKVDELADAIRPVIDLINKVKRAGTDLLIGIINRISFKKFIDIGFVDKITKAFEYLIDLGRKIGDSFKNAFKGIMNIDVSSWFVKIGDAAKNTAQLMNRAFSPTVSKKFSIILKGIYAVFDSLFFIASEVAHVIWDMFPKTLPEINLGILDFLVMLAEMSMAFRDNLKEGEKVRDFLKSMVGHIKTVAGWIGELASKVFGFSKDMANKVNFKGITKSFRDVLKEGSAFGDFLRDTGDKFGYFGSMIGEAAGKIIDFGTSIKDNLIDTFKSARDSGMPFFDWLKDAFSRIDTRDLLISGGVIAAILAIRKVMKFFDGMKGGVDAIKTAFTGITDGVIGALAAYQKNLKYDNIMKIAIAIGVLAASFKLLSTIQWKDLGRALIGTVAVIGVMVAAYKLLEKVSDNVNTKTVAKIMIMAGTITTVIATLAGVTALMTLLDPEKALRSIAWIGILLAEVALFMVLVDKSSVGAGGLLGMVGVSVALAAMVGVIKLLTLMDPNEVEKGIMVIGALMGIIGLFSILTGQGASLLGVSVGMVGIAVALGLMVVPLQKLGRMKWDDIAKAVAVIGSLFAIIALTLPIITGGIVGVAVVLGVIASLYLVVVVIQKMVDEFERMAEISWGSIFSALGKLAVGLTLLTLMATLLTAVSPLFIVAGAALLVFGIGLAAVIIPLTLFINAVDKLFISMVKSSAAMIDVASNIMKALTVLGVELATFIEVVIPALLASFRAVGDAVVETVIWFVLLFARAARDNMDEIVSIGAEITISILEGIEKYSDPLMKGAARAMVRLVFAMAEAVEENQQSMINAVTKLMGELMIVAIKSGALFAKAIFGWIPGANDAIDDVADSMEAALRKELDSIPKLGSETGDKFADELESTSGHTREAAHEHTDAMGGVFGAFEVGDFIDPGADLTGLLTGSTGEVGEATGGIVDAITGEFDLLDTLGIADTKIGQFVSSFKGNKKKEVKKAAKDVSVESRESMKSVNWESAGRKSLNDVGKGVDSRRGWLSNKLINLGSAAVGWISRANTYNSGWQFATGFGNGITARTGWVYSRAENLAYAANRAVNSAIQTRSPSRLLFKTGRFFSEGFGNGIFDGIKYVVGKAVALARGTSQAVEDGLDYDPDLEVKLKIVVDDDDYDWDNLDPDDKNFKPNPKYTSGMAERTESQMRQNANNSNDYSKEENHTEIKNEYNVEINTTGSLSRAEIKRYTGIFQDEIKRQEDDDKSSRGEKVRF